MAASDQPTKTFKILVVDDDPGIRSLLGITFASDEWDVRMATNGAEAIEAVRTDPFDAIILDLQMPVMDGRQAVRQLQAEGIQTPVLLLSAYGAKQAQGELDTADAMDKPFDPFLVADRVRDLIQRGVGGEGHSLSH